MATYNSAGFYEHRSIIDEFPLSNNISHSDEDIPTSEENLRERMTEFIRDKIQRLSTNPDDPDDTCPNAEKRRILVIALIILLDPMSTPFTLSLRDMHHFLQEGHTFAQYLNIIAFGVLHGYVQACLDAARKWAQKRKGNDDDIAVRLAADKHAQTSVVGWYNRCVFTGPGKPVEGAHIIPVRAKHTDLNELWQALRAMWPLPDEQDIVATGNEMMNVLPLASHVHNLWDRFAFGLRPLEHPDDPTHKRRLLLQVFWFRDLDQVGSLSQSPWNFGRDGGFCDLTRPATDTAYESVQHGDVYELTTEDPEGHPLPDMRLLNIQFAMHKLMAGMKAAGSLRIIFSGSPPPDTGQPPYVVETPAIWANLLDEAVAADVMDRRTADLWEKGFQWHVVRRCQEFGIALPSRTVAPA